jgi:hypothetical protein
MLTPVLGVLFLLFVVAGLLFQGRRLMAERRRTRSLRNLLDQTDRLENDLKECRRRLDRAHAVMSVVPDQPAVGGARAGEAIDRGLRALLEHRLWIRDHLETARQHELDAAVDALLQVRGQMEPQLRALGQAQQDLDQAVRDRIERDAQEPRQ